MEKILFVPRVLAALEEAASVRRGAALILKALAILSAVVALISFFVQAQEIFKLPGEALPGGIFYLFTWLLASYVAVHATLVRAGHAARLDDGPQPFLGLAALVTKLWGEVAGSALLLLGLGNGVMTWFAGKGVKAAANPLLRLGKEAAPASTFAAGGSLILKGLFCGLLVFLAAHALAELLQFASAARRRQQG